MEYLKYIDENKENLLSDLADLVKIRSVNADPVGNMPYGEKVQEVFELMLKKGEEAGFVTDRVGNYGGHIEFGIGKDIVAILAHLDVVPEGTGWTKDPFGAEIEDGKMYGRGTSDDKGPLMAAFYAMKALKESGFEPTKRIRLILGLDEEVGFTGMEKYFEVMEQPAYGFTPDANFPAINCEKGCGDFRIAKKLAKVTQGGLELRSFTGGTASNMVPSNARVVLRDTTEYKKGKEPADRYEKIKLLINQFKDETNYKINYKSTGKSLEITTQGAPAHGARPFDGLNAVSIMCQFLSKLSFINEDINDFLDFYEKYLGFDVFGEKLGLKYSDEESGDFTLNVGIINIDTKAIDLTLNYRTPISMTPEDMYKKLEPTMNHYEYGIIKVKFEPSVYYAKDSVLVSKLMNVYREFTGDTESEPLAIGGGTYAKSAKNVIAFGMVFPGETETMHQQDEFINIDNLMLSTKIYAAAIKSLAED